MRIIGGKLKGSTLLMPKNRHTRPLKDLARESIFNLLIHSNKFSFQLERSKILDLYSGTGSFGLECLSRGAESVFFVEEKKDVVSILEKNIKKLKLHSKTKIFSNDVFDTIKKNSFFNLKFDLIFCDPPFKDKNILKLLEYILNKNLLSKNGIIIMHRSRLSRDELDGNFKIVEERIYGISKIIFTKFLN